MEILRQLVKTVPCIPVQEVIVGVFSTLVKFERGCGIASTLRYGRPHQRINRSGGLESLTLDVLAEYVFSPNLLDASVGMAAINGALIQPNRRYRHINAKEILFEQGRDKIVGVIGHFPFLRELQNYFKKLYIFEKQPEDTDYHETDIPDLLPEVEVAAITGTAFTNHTLEEILGWIPEQSFKMILGPSTPLSPLLFDYGIDVLAGSIVRDYQKLSKLVMQATPNRDLLGIEYVALSREDR